ncbi:hypothetical protein HMPREF0281_01630 [Corynebacterium ammoniagenes DSM 20306]|jgi:hypothetical protein|uniref:Uncharacterized protein n=1 Tax=Corynebacterium ammoniagenes DSM 20306 TaxID=649754 RepID=A0ABP2II25_CORAM|nr:hypothetical protein HMPREF0281_01630 [Corynebacterium ammoniagenes DSM 20306]
MNKSPKKFGAHPLIGNIFPTSGFCYFWGGKLRENGGRKVVGLRQLFDSAHEVA